MEIVNPNSDCHIHSSNFSDGIMSVSTIINEAIYMGLDKVIITDHSDISRITMDAKIITRERVDEIIKQYSDVDIQVEFGIECDIINEIGDLSDTLCGKRADFNILSLHRHTFVGNLKMINKVYETLLEKHSNQTDLIGHPCSLSTSKYLDINAFIELVNYYEIPVELNGKNLLLGRTDINKLITMLKKAKYIYVNSDAHDLYQFRFARELALKFLKKNITN